MEEHYIKDVGKITYVYGVNLEEHKTVIEKQQKRIAELEQELTEMTRKYEFSCRPVGGLVDTAINLEKQLAELKENAIVPRFKYKDYVYAIYSDKDIFKGQIDIFDYYTKEYLVFFSEDIGSDWFSENLLFTTEQEALEKLKEMKGNE